MDKSGRLLRAAAGGSVIAMAGSFLGRILSLAFQVMICRMLAPEDDVAARYYGLFTTSLILCQVLRLPFALGLPKGSLRYMSIAVERREFETVPAIVTLAMATPMVIGSLGGLCLHAFAGLIAETCFHDASLTPVIQTMSFGLPFYSLMMVASELTRSFKTTKYSVFIEDVVFPALQIVLFLGLLRSGYGFQAVLYSFVASSLLSAALALFILVRQIRRNMPGVLTRPYFRRHAIRPGYWKELIIYSLPFMPIGMTSMGFHFSDILLLNIFMDAASVGLYAGAAKISLLFASLVRTTNIAFAPLIASQYGVQDTGQIGMLYKSLTRWMFYAALPILVFVLVAREPMMAMLGLGSSSQTALALAILAIGHVYVVFSSGAGMILAMTAHPYKELTNIVVGLALNILFNILLIPRFGLVGAALAATASRLVINSVRIVIVYRIFKIYPGSRAYLLPLGVGLLVFGLHEGLAFTMPISLAGHVAMGTLGALAVGMCILLKGLSPDDRLLLAQARNKLAGRRPGPPTGMKIPPLDMGNDGL